MVTKKATEKKKKATSGEKKQNKTKEKLSDIELAELYLKKIHLIKIEGQLHAFNGKWYFPVDRKQLSVSIKNELYSYVIKSGYRLVNSISKALRDPGKFCVIGIPRQYEKRLLGQEWKQTFKT